MPIERQGCPYLFMLCVKVIILSTDDLRGQTVGGAPHVRLRVLNKN